MHLPEWTVLTNVVSKESSQWVGTLWEFFDKEYDAEKCFIRQRGAGNCPTKRRFDCKIDYERLGSAHRILHCQLCKNRLVQDVSDKSLLRCSNPACFSQPVKIKPSELI